MFEERVSFHFRYKGKSCFNTISTIVTFDTLEDITKQLRDFINHRDKEVEEAYWTNESEIRTYIEV